jgi:NAD(P)-dependent dehydrogenase (short-subunit alcohol dehydrogenase family)
MSAGGASGIVNGKVAIVTGAGRGIGREVALLMGREGARVVVCDVGAALDGAGRDEGPAGEVAAEIRKAGGEAIACVESVADPAAAQRIVASALERFGDLHIIVNNAGILRDAIFHKMSHADWQAVLDVHLNGSFNMSKAAAAHFRQQGGAFVHFTSTSGLIGNLGQANYSAAKMGIVGLSRSIALDMSRFGVRSNCVSPFAWSRMIDSIPAADEKAAARLDRMRAMTPAQIAPLVVFLASDRAKDVTGQIFAVRGNEVFLMSQPRPVRSLHRGEGWSPELLAEHMLPAFQPSMTPLESSADVFSWDPV